MEKKEKRKNKCYKQKIFSNVADCNPTIPINTLNVYGLYTHIKGRDCQIGLKKKKPKNQKKNIVYKRHILNINDQIGCI